LGVLLYGHGKNAYWYGSQLSIEETRKLAPHQNATGLQVTSAILAGMVRALENPDAGIVEADEIDFRRCLEVQTRLCYTDRIVHALTAPVARIQAMRTDFGRPSSSMRFRA
jgi:homospermidine synthase